MFGGITRVYKVTRALVCSSFVLCTSSALSQTELTDEVSSENTTANPSSTIGPTQPIGHSLKTPEAQKRIESLIAESKAEVHLKRPTPSYETGTLVDGQYGFSGPTELSGVPKSFVNLGRSSTSYAFVVEKLHHRLTVFKVTEDKEYEVIKTFRAITGKDPNDKVVRGDLRTPEGIYFVTGYIDGKELPPKYGLMAFTLDYPNIYDQRQRKSGSGIWIHATDYPQRLATPYDTEGCVVVSNEDITELQKYIVAFETPVVITKEMTTGTLEEVTAPRKPAMEMIDAWRKSWESSDFEQYMSFYSENFKSLGKSKEAWQSYKQRLSTTREGDIKVTIGEPKILAFEDQLLVIFLQNYSSKHHADFGRKFLYLQWERDRYRIIAEKWYPVKRTETATSEITNSESKM